MPDFPPGDPTRELIHKVNNLLSVIYTQTAVGRSENTLAAAHAALEQIQRAAESTAAYVKACRE